MAVSKPRPADNAGPDQRKLTGLQAQRLSSLSGVDANALEGLTITQIADKHRFRIDPTLLLFRRVCGRVVKTDPATGIDYPVPFATVHVEDTDCSLLGYFPTTSTWGWYFPFKCRRETIATARTDACGNFCVLVPRFDIDWVLRWRRQRRCFPIAFERPSLRDLIDDLQPIPRIPPIGPGPVERVRATLPNPLQLKQLEDRVGIAAVARLKRADAAGFGDLDTDLDTLLDAPALMQAVPPPLPKAFAKLPPRSAEQRTRGDVDEQAIVRDTLSAQLRIDPDALRSLDLRRYIGPFKRCIDVLVPEWKRIVDVPDVTFRVTQDTDGDGDADVIYGETHFDVRWNDTDTGPVVLHARANAVAGPLVCGGPGIACGDTPAITAAGLMAVGNDPAVYDPATGYVLSANRPKDGSMMRPDAATPFFGGLNIFGCLNTRSGATHYRVMHRFQDQEGGAMSGWAPFTGRSWEVVPPSGPAITVSPNAQGWYPIQAFPAGSAPTNQLLDWPTPAYGNGQYILKVELGNVSGAVMDASAEISFRIDNSAPRARLEVWWKFQSESDGAFRKLEGPCPVVPRNGASNALEFRVTLEASARHLRDCAVSAGGCGSGDFVEGAGTSEFWHDDVGDTTHTLVQRYTLAAHAAQGSYAFSGFAASRAMSPSGIDSGQLSDWEYDPTHVYVTPYFPFAIID